MCQPPALSLFLSPLVAALADQAHTCICIAPQAPGACRMPRIMAFCAGLRGSGVAMRGGAHVPKPAVCSAAARQQKGGLVMLDVLREPMGVTQPLEEGPRLLGQTLSTNWACSTTRLQSSCGASV